MKIGQDNFWLKFARVALFMLIAFAVGYFGSSRMAHAQSSVQDAVNSMSGLGAGALANIQNDDPSQSVPKYSTQNASEALYGSGDMLPTDPGNLKITGCQVNPADPNLYTRQDCESVNFVMKNGKVRPNITVSTKDPIVASNRKITNDPRETLEKYKWIVPVNSDGSVGSLPSDACKATTITTPPMFEEKVCTFYKGAENFLCKAPLVVNVVPHFNYQCNDTFGINSNESCTKVLHVSCINDCPSPAISFNWADNPARPSFIPARPITFSTQNMGSGVYRTTVTTPDVSVSGGMDLDYRTFKLTIGSVVAFDYMKVISSTQSLNAKALGSPYSFYVFSSRFPGISGCSSCTYSPGIQVESDMLHLLAGGENAMRLDDTTNGGQGVTLVIEYKQAQNTCNQTCTESLENNCTALEQRSLP